MATRRMITSAIWRDDWFGQLDFFDQALWIGLFSTCADDQGRLLDNPILIRADVFPYKDTPISEVERALQGFTDAGRIARYDVDGKRLIQIINWWEHQQPQWAQPSQWLPPEGWHDRVRTRMGGKYIEENWSDKPSREDNPAGQSPDHVQLVISPEDTSREDNPAGQSPDHVHVLDSVQEGEGAEPPPARDFIDDVVASLEQKHAGVADPFQDGDQWLTYRDAALIAYKELTGLYADTKVGKPAIVKLAGEDGFNPARWRNSVETCRLAGVNPRNIGCMIDTYRAGGDYGAMQEAKRNGGKGPPAIPLPNLESQSYPPAFLED